MGNTNKPVWPNEWVYREPLNKQVEFDGKITVVLSFATRNAFSATKIAGLLTVVPSAHNSERSGIDNRPGGSRTATCRYEIGSKISQAGCDRIRVSAGKGPKAKVSKSIGFRSASAARCRNQLRGAWARKRGERGAISCGKIGARNSHGWIVANTDRSIWKRRNISVTSGGVHGGGIYIDRRLPQRKTGRQEQENKTNCQDRRSNHKGITELNRNLELKPIFRPRRWRRHL